MKKEIIVLGDIEMGAGTLTDDFISDAALSNLIILLSKKKHSVDLVLNGDTLDFLKCPTKIYPKTIYSRHLTKKISLEKLKKIHKAHRKVFDALKNFLKSENKYIYFILGNHDQDLVFKEVQEKIKEILCEKERVIFPGLFYEKYRVHIEHGQQYDFLNMINPQNLFIKYKEESLLNYTFVSFGVISELLPLKEKYPFLERIKPYPLLFGFRKDIIKKINLRVFSYFLKSVFYYPLRYFYDPTYKIPRELFREFWVRLRNSSWDVPEVIDVFKKRKEKKENKIYVFGHVHRTKVEKNRNWVIIDPGTWRDEYEIDKENKLLIPKNKNYVSIKISNCDISWKLIHYPIKRSNLKFEDVCNDEIKYLKLAAKEENFKIRI